MNLVRPLTDWLVRRRAPTAWRAALAVLLVCAATAASAQPITVAAAASLGEPLREIGARFEAERPGARVRFTFAASGVLLQQIVQGAPVDLFVSADADTVQRGLAAAALEAGTRRDIARNALVVVGPADGRAAPASLADLVQPGLRRIAIGKPASVPAGRYARQVLEAGGLWAALEPRFVHADSVRQALDYAARGEVGAAFVYRTDAALMPDKVRVLFPVDGHAPITYPSAIVSGSRQPALAREFQAYLLAPPAQAILARRGFAAP